MAEIQHGKALHLNRSLTGTDKQPSDPHRHIAEQEWAEQRMECNGVVALAGQPAPARRTAATLLAHRGHPRRNDLGPKRRGQPPRLGQPKPRVSQAGLLVRLDAGPLSLRHDTRTKLRHQLHPPHQLRHQTHRFPKALNLAAPPRHPRILNVSKSAILISAKLWRGKTALGRKRPGCRGSECGFSLLTPTTNSGRQPRRLASSWLRHAGNADHPRPTAAAV
jgi:hypothetical protein